MSRTGAHKAGQPSGQTHHATPWYFVRRLEALFGARFDLDPCCQAATAKALDFYTIEDDGLTQPWHGHVYMNPPYGADNLMRWCRKAAAEVAFGNALTVTGLVPNNARDTAWWHKGVLDTADAIHDIAGRLQFELDGVRLTRPDSCHAVVRWTREAVRITSRIEGASMLDRSRPLRLVARAGIPIAAKP